VLDTSFKIGYGWFKSQNKRFGETAYYMNGRAPGFASFVLYLPHAQTTVVVLSNIYSSATTTIGYDIAALSLDLPYEQFHFREPAPDTTELKTCTGTFQFGSDFYQPNAEVTLMASGPELSLRWPSGDATSPKPIRALKTLQPARSGIQTLPNKPRWTRKRATTIDQMERQKSSRPRIVLGQ
jgi:hypothetical protein